jgi:hypothetical protein
LICFTKGTNFVLREIGGETLIVPIRANAGEIDSIYTLNEIGTEIWRLVDGQTTTAQIAETISTIFNVSPEDAERDTIEFLSTLEVAGLIHATPTKNL